MIDDEANESIKELFDSLKKISKQFKIGGKW